MTPDLLRGLALYDRPLLMGPPAYVGLQTFFGDIGGFLFAFSQSQKLCTDS
jgi:hypothetical protein